MGATKVVYSSAIGGQIPAGLHSGPGALLVAQGIYEESLTAKTRIGERLQVGDRVFRYASAGAALLAGITCQSAILGGALTTLQTSRPVAVAAPIGASRIYTTALTTEQVKDVFADGWVVIHDDSAASCFLMRIKGNSILATSGVASYLELYDPLYVALTTNDQLEIMANPYKNVITIASATTMTGAFVGIAPRAVQSGYYFWLQTNGYAAAVPDAALDLDELVMLGDTAGGVEKDSSTSLLLDIGMPVLIGTAAEGCIINLQLLP